MQDRWLHQEGVWQVGMSDLRNIIDSRQPSRPVDCALWQHVRVFKHDGASFTAQMPTGVAGS